jgi:hypothetical protein
MAGNRGERVYGIPLDCLRSKAIERLFGARRVLNGEREAAASARVMGTAFAT